MENPMRIQVAPTKMKTDGCGRGRRSFTGFGDFAIVLIALLLSTDGIASVRMKTDDLNSKDAIHIAGFLPRSAPMKISNYGEDGRGVLDAVNLAVYHINVNKLILPDHILNIVWNDTECSVSDGLEVFSDMMNNPPLKYMLFGGVCNEVTDQLSKTARQWKTAQLSYTATHPMFTKESHPNLFRIVPSDNEFNPPRLALLKKYNWMRVATIYQNEQRYSLAHDNLLAELVRMGVEVVTNQSLDYDLPAILQNLKEKDAHIILGNFNETWARSIFCEACREKLYGPKYQWLIAAPYTHLWWRRNINDVNCATSEMEVALKGALLMDILPVSTNSNMSTISGFTADQYNELYQVINQGVYSRLHGYAYDGVWAIALALHNIHKFYPDREKEKMQNKDLLRTFKYHDENWQTAFLASFEAMSFIGVTGKVQFRDNGRIGTILIKQMRDFMTIMADDKVGEFDSTSETLSLEKEVMWNGDNPPTDRSIGDQTQSAMTVASTARIVLASCILTFASNLLV